MNVPYDHKATHPLEAKRTHAQAMGGEERLARRRAPGRLDARERLTALFDDDTGFLESGLLAVSHRPEDRNRTPADGKVTGVGRVAGRLVGSVSNDFTTLGASSSLVNGQKIRRLRGVCEKIGAPLVYLSESSGARIPDRMGAEGRAILGQDPHEYRRVRTSPWASALFGACFGSAAWYACLSDFVAMRRDAVLAVAGARVIGRALGGSIDPLELGGWRVHTGSSGLVDLAVDTDQEAIAAVQRFLSYLPSESKCVPPYDANWSPPVNVTGLAELVPASRSQTYDMRKLIAAIADANSVFELKSRFARSLVTCLVRIHGQTVGIIANNPLYKGGAIDVDACAKATSFLVLCDSFNVPLAFLCDTPGFLVGPDGEKKGAAGHIMSWMNALALFSMPKVTIVIRKSYGQAYLNMGGGRNSDEMAAWPGSDFGFMDPRTGAAVIGGNESDPAKLAALAEKLARESGPEGLAARYQVHSILEPNDTRSWLHQSITDHTDRITSGIGTHRLNNWPTTI